MYLIELQQISIRNSGKSAEEGFLEIMIFTPLFAAETFIFCDFLRTKRDIDKR